MRLIPRRAYVSGSAATFAQVLANATGSRARWRWASTRIRAATGGTLARQRLEEGDVDLGEDAWLNPPRDTLVPDTEDTQVVVLAHVRHPPG